MSAAMPTQRHWRVARTHQQLHLCAHYYLTGRKSLAVTDYLFRQLCSDEYGIAGMRMADSVWRVTMPPEDLICILLHTGSPAAPYWTRRYLAWWRAS